MIVIDTLGRTREHCYGLFGWCLDCSAQYWKFQRPARAPRALFDIDVDKLIAERGADHPWSNKMPPVPCPRCGSRRIEIRVEAPDRIDGHFLRSRGMAWRCGKI